MSKHEFTNVRVPIEKDNPAIQRLEFKCIKCGACKAVCTNEIGVCGTYDLAKTGDVPVCVYCGQCANVCPVDSITEKVESYEVLEAINDPEKIVVVNTSPSVRVSLGEEFGMADGSFVEGKMVALLRKLGVDYVLDTSFAADMTIVEEASELVERITEGKLPLPQFTSCCPAWVKFAEIYYPEMLPHISTAKSPIGMQGPTVKTYFAKKMGIDPKKIVNVALTPCTAKKFEIRREEMCDAGKYLGIEELRDMDHVITTREVAMLARDAGIDFAALEDDSFDKLMGEASGAAKIFGNTGGVMEAAIRTAYAYITNEPVPVDLLKLEPVRGLEGIKEATVKVKDLEIKVAVVYGTANARRLIEKIKAGKANYHFVEVMTCPGGCIGGGGQPKDREYKGDALRAKRIAGLYRNDSELPIRLSHENQELIAMYKEFYGKPLSELAEAMLHTSYHDCSELLGDSEPVAVEVAPAAEPKAAAKKYRCKVCGYIYEGDQLPADFVCPWCGKGVEFFEEIPVADVVAKKYRCKVCGYIYEGDQLPADFVCPVCNKGAEFFEEI